MKVKQLYQKYKNYDILLFGKPLDKQTTPFSCLPVNMKQLNEYVVKDIKIENEQVEALNFDMSLKFKGKQKYKGTIYAYVGKE